MTSPTNSLSPSVNNRGTLIVALGVFKIKDVCSRVSNQVALIEINAKDVYGNAAAAAVNPSRCAKTACGFTRAKRSTLTMTVLFKIASSFNSVNDKSYG